MGTKTFARGFTIVELLIVIVVIAILATITLVAYNGLTSQARDVALKAEVRQNVALLEMELTENGRYPAACGDAPLKVGSGHTLSCRIVPDRSGYCLALSRGDSTFFASSTDNTPKRGVCDGYILVPGNAALGTSPFWVMKYEAKNVNGVATSQAAGLPWVSISQTDAITAAQAACEGCALVSEARWMALAGNIISNPANWSGGSVGAGFIYRGHSDGVVNVAQAASSSDANGYIGTGDSSSSNPDQRRTLSLTNGEVLWDLAGNVNEWTPAQYSGAQPGVAGDMVYTWRNYTTPGFSWASLPISSRPVTASSLAAGWNDAQGIGAMLSNPTATTLRAMFRGGNYENGWGAGILMLSLNLTPSDSHVSVGFRVAR